MVTKSPARDGSLAVLQLAAVPRDEIVSGCSPFLDGGFGAYIGSSGRWFSLCEKHRFVTGTDGPSITGLATVTVIGLQMTV